MLGCIAGTCGEATTRSDELKAQMSGESCGSHTVMRTQAVDVVCCSLLKEDVLYC